MNQEDRVQENNKAKIINEHPKIKWQNKRTKTHQKNGRDKKGRIKKEQN